VEKKFVLNAISGLPTRQALDEMLYIARDGAGRTIQRPFQDNNRHFLISVVCVTGSSPKDISDPRWTTLEPMWHLQEVIGSMQIELCVHKTSDTERIEKMVRAELQGSTFDSIKALGSPPGVFSGQHGEIDEEPDAGGYAYDGDGGRGGPRSFASGTSLSGTLSNVSIFNVMQSIELCAMTGRLDVSQSLENAEIFFVEGSLVHAVFHTGQINQEREITGHEAVTEALTLTDGSFNFVQNVKTGTRTVKMPLQTLLLKGATLQDYMVALERDGVTMDTVLVKNREATAEELKVLLKDALPLDIGQQKFFLDHIDGTSPLIKIVRDYQLKRSDWAPIVFNLLGAKLVSVPGRVELPEAVESFVFDSRAAFEVARGLLRPETGMHSSQMFSYLVDQEMRRHQISGLPFSLIIFEVYMRQSMTTATLPNASLLAVVELCRNTFESSHMYFLSHFNELDFALILPYTDARQAMKQCVAMTENWEKRVKSMRLAFGVASMPEYAYQLDSLINKAEGAKKEAKAKGQSICLAAQ
jgi:GGDEF domain-containing protein